MHEEVAVLAVLSGLFAVAGFAAVGMCAGKSPLDEGRIKAVAAMLVEKPTTFGRPITDRAAWNRLAEHKSYQGVVRRAEPLLKEPIPELPDDLYLDFSRTGNRTRWQKVNSRRRSRVPYLVLAECLENKGRFVPALEDLIRALCAERTWVMPAHDRSLDNFHGKSIDIDLASSALAWELTTAAYLLGDKLSPETRALIRDNVKRRVLDPYRDMVEGKRKANWWTRTTNNWNAVCLAGVTGAALAQLESREERAFYVVAAEHYSKNFLKGFTSDGYCSEGVGYWNYGFGRYLMLAEIIHQATRGGVDLMAGEKVKAAAVFGARIEIVNSVYPAFADCGVTSRPSPRIMYYVSRRLGLGMKEWDEYDPVSPSGGLFDALMYSFPNSASESKPAAEEATQVSLRSWFDQAGILVCRGAKGTESRFGVAMKGGHNAEHHNHNDVGSYVAVVGGQAVLLDPGSEVYTARTFSKDRYVSTVLNSFGHPVPIVAGQLQQKGRKAHGEVVKTEFTDGRDTFVIDMRSAYTVDGLAKLQRTFVYSREGAGSLTVRDEVAFDAPEAFGTALVTLGRWKRIDDNSLMVYGSEEAVRVDIDTGGAEFEVRSEELKEDVRTPTLPTRIGIDLKQPAAAAAITLTIKPLSHDEAGPLLRNGGFEDGEWAWRIPKKGMGSLSNEQASSGKTSLKIVDTSKKLGSNISSARVPIGGPGPYELRGKVFKVSGSGVGMYVKYLDRDRKLLNRTDHRGWIDSVGTAAGSANEWQAFAFRVTPPEGTAYLQVWIHSTTGAIVTAYLDDLEIVRAEAKQ